MYQSILVRSGRSAVAFFSAIVAVALVGSLFVVPSVVFADVAPVTVGVSPALVKGGAVNTAYTFTVTKNSGDNITYVQIETSVLSINTDLSTVVCPTGLGTWTKSAEATKVICSKAQLGGNPITTNATISFQATAPSSDIAAAWTVTTLDTASAQVVNSPVTTVDATAPTISSITTKDTDSDGKVDTATIVFTEAVKDSTFAPNDFSIGGSAGTSFSGAADDNTLDVVVVSGVTGTEAKDVTYTKSAGAGADMVGNLLADVNTAAFNEIDGAAPVFMSARTQSPTTIHLTFSEDLLGTTITNTDFSVTGFTLTTPDATDTDTPGIVRLTVSTPFGSGDTPHVSYTGSVKDSPNLNTAPNRSDVTPTDGIAPTFTATRTAINTIVLTFSENVTSSGVDTDSFTVVGASAVSAGAVVGNTSITLTTTGLTTTDGTPAVNYVAANGDVVDTATNEVADGGAVVAADQVAPTIAITSSASPGPTNGPSIPMTVTFSETVTGFDIDDITVGNGTKAGFVAVSGTVYTFNITSPGQGTVTVDVAGSEAQDATLNNNTAATQFSITYDSIAPDITSIVLSDSALKVGETSLVTITFTEPVTGFTNADITTVDNGTLTDVASGDNITWTATFTPTTNFTGATNVLTITKTGIADLAGNAGVGTTNSGNYAIDTVLPTVGVTMGAATFKVGETTAVTFTFSEAPADFTTDDVTVGSGTIGAINTANPLIQTAIYTPTNDVEVGTNIITVGTAWTDAAGNTPLAGDDSPNYTIDTKKPSVALASVTANTTNGLIAVTAQFSESVTGFDATDVTVGNGAVGDFVAVDGDSYTFNVNPTDGGSVAVTIEVLADKAVDAAGNSNTASNQLTRTSDTIAPNAPTVTLLDPINNANKASATLRIVGESGTTYNYSIDDAGNAGTTAVVGSGTLTGGDQTVTGISVSDLDDGTLTASVTLTDTATNTGNAGTDTATKDVGVPSAPSTPDLAAASDSNIDTDNITNVTTPIFTGTAESGSTVTAYDTNGTTVIGTGIATGGNYSMVVSTLSSGVHSITVKTTDAAGNTSSASSALSVTIDTVLPNAVFSAATDDATPVTGALTSGQTTNDTALVLSGTNEAGSTVQVFNGTSSLAPAVVSGTTWSYTATVANGTTYQFNVKETDVAGNTSSATGDFTVIGDTTVPSTPTISSIATDNKINDSEKAAVHVIGTAEANSTVSVTLTDTLSAFVTVSGSANGTGAYDITLDTTALTDGTVTPSVTATDAAGNVSSAATTPTATKDVVAPNAPTTPDLTAGTDSNVDTDNITNDPTPDFTTTAEAGSTIVVYDGTTSVGSMTATAGPDTITVPTLSAGVHSITVKTTDAAGNTSSASSALSVTIDTANPTAVFSVATDDVGSVTGALVSGAKTDDTALVLSGTNEAGSTVQVFNGTSSLAPAVVSGTTWSYTATVANGTTYQFNVKETDVAGNTSSATGDFTVIGDTTVPTVTLTEDQADMIVRDADTVVVTATFNEAMTSAPTVSIGSLVTNAPMTNTSGNIWTYSWNVPASNDGSAVVTVAGTDLAGNAYAGTNSLTFTIDNTAPVVAITAPAADARVNAAQVITFTDGEFTAPQCSIDNSVWVTCTSGVTTLNSVTGFSSLANGSFTLYLRDTDTAGNVGTTQVALVKDTAAPSVTSKTPGANAVGIDPAGNITVVFSENVVIDASNVSGVTAGVTGSGTDTATINPTSNLANNTTYTITLTGVTDMAGNTLPTTSWSFTTSGSYSIPLSSGWNLVSFPVVPTNTAASSVLGSLNDSTKIDSIWKYDPDNRAWGVYHPGDTNNTSDFSTLTAGEGYWVSYLSGTPGSIAGNGNLFQEGNSTPPQKSLAAGWNLIGYYQLENTTTAKADNALSTVSGQWTQLRTYNNTTKQFQSVIGTNPMGPGAGYWIFMKSSSFAPYLYGPGTADSN